VHTFLSMENVFNAAGELASFAHGVDCDEAMCTLRNKQVVTIKNNQAVRHGSSPEEFFLFILADSFI
jgi:hypothetical protein